LEEVLKTRLGMYRSDDNEPLRRSRDPLFQHRAEDALSAAPTIGIGSRLAAAIGASRVEELIEQARSGALTNAAGIRAVLRD
jgi:hypothetical protein